MMPDAVPDPVIIPAGGNLHAAAAKAGMIFRRGPGVHVEIELDDCYYALDRTLVVNRENGPAAGQSLMFRGRPGTRPAVGAFLALKEWTPARRMDIPEYIGLSPEQLDRIHVAEVPDEAGFVHTAFVGETILPRGRSPELEGRITEAECLRSFNVAREEDRFLLRRVPVPGDVLKTIRFSTDLEILFTAVPWQLSILPVEGFDCSEGYVHTREEGTVPAFRKLHGPSRLENQPEFIESPGEWAFDSEHRLLFFYPRTPGDLGNFGVPLLKQLVQVEGEIDYDGPADRPLENVHFHGIDFLHAGRDTKDSRTKARGLQHDWEFFDRGNSLLRFRGAENCSVRNCRFAASGGVGIRADLHARNLLIENNAVHNVGSMGILLCGYGPGTKDVNRRNIIRNNLIHHTGELYHHGHAIFLWQSGENIIAGNTIHHVPRKAVGIAGIRLPLLERRDVTWDDSSLLVRWNEIDAAAGEEALRLSGLIAEGGRDAGELRNRLWCLYMPFLHGRNNRVEYNEVYRALEKLGDGAAVNVSGAGEGNLVYRNYVHHIKTNRASGVLRTDDWQSGTTFQENVLYMANIPGIARKNLTHLVNNFIIDVSTRQYVRFASFPDECAGPGALIVKNIFCDTQGGFTLYREGYTSDGMVHPRDTHSDFNLICSFKQPEFPAGILESNRKNGLDGNSISGNPGFKDPNAGDFRLRPESPAHALGILSIDVGETGISDEFPESLREFDDESGFGAPEDYHRGRDSSTDEYLFW